MPEFSVSMLTLFKKKEGEGQKDPPPPTSFSAVTSVNTGVSPQNFR